MVRVLEVHHDLLVRKAVAESNWCDWKQLDQKAQNIMMIHKIGVYGEPSFLRPRGEQLVVSDAQRYETTHTFSNINRFQLNRIW